MRILDIEDKLNRAFGLRMEQKHIERPEHGLQEQEGMTAMEKRQAELLKPMTRGTVGEVSDEVIARRTPQEVAAAKARTQYYSEIFASRGPIRSPQPCTETIRGHIIRDSVVTVEVRTNIIVEDEYNFLSELSTFLGVIYDRDPSSIMVSLEHTSCMLFQGNFDPAYSLTVSAVRQYVTPTLNDKITVLLQCFLHDEIGCPAERGIIIFKGIEEENLAVNGLTLRGKIEGEIALERLCMEDERTPSKIGRGTKRGTPAAKGVTRFTDIQEESRLASPTPTLCPPMSRKGDVANKKRPHSLHRHQHPLLPLQDHAALLTPPSSPYDNVSVKSYDSAPKTMAFRGRSKSLTAGRRKKHVETDTSAIPVPDLPWAKSPMDVKAEKLQKVGKRRSLLGLFKAPSPTKRAFGP